MMIELRTEHALDFIEGGGMVNADDNRACIRRITPGKKIAFIGEPADAALGTPVVLAFQSSTGKRTAMITHDHLPTRAEADGLRAAWGAALERLKVSLVAAAMPHA